MTNIHSANYLYYNQYLDAPIDYSKISKIKILKITQNIPLSPNLLKYIDDNKIKYLEFYSDFNYQINNLPICVEHIFFHPVSKFNHPLINLPANLKTLILGNGYWETMEYLPCSLLFLGYHKILRYFNEKNEHQTIVHIDEIINTNLPNLIYISIPYDICEQININSRLYKKKIIKTSANLYISFINFIEDKLNLDYFMVHG
jgi:hypothetical protein